PQSVMQRDEKRRQARVGRKPAVELANAARVLTVLRWVKDAPAPECVVGRYDAARPQKPDRPAQIERQRRLVRTQDDQLELLAVQRRERIQRNSLPHLDPVSQPGALDPAASEAGVLRVLLQSEYLAIVRQGSRQADRRVAAECAYLEYASRGDGAYQDLKQP